MVSTVAKSRSLIAAIVFGSCSLLGQGPKLDDLNATWYAIDHVAWLSDRYSTTHGGWPEDLSDLCSRMVGECLDEGGRTTLDHWGEPLQLRIENDAPLVTSAGEDGEFGSGDDVSYSREVESGRAATLAGCYGVTDPAEGLPSRLTLSLTRTGVQGFDLLPVRSYLSAMWRPWARDSVLLVWSGTPGRVFRLEQDGTLLAGEASVGGGRAHRPIQLVRLGAGQCAQ